MPKPPEVETLERVKRIETRLTAFLVSQGVTTPSQKPEFMPTRGLRFRARLLLPSPHTSMSEIMAAIPEDFDGAVDLYVGQSYLGIVSRSKAA